MDFIVKEAAMSLEIENETWSSLVNCSFCSNVSSKLLDNSQRYVEGLNEGFTTFWFTPPPIITIPLSEGDKIIVDPHSANGSLGPRNF